MSTKPESTFIASVHRKLKGVDAPYHEKMNNPFHSGTADVWYSGDKGDLWVEYKFIQRIPRSEEILPELTPRQSRWLNNRFDEGRNVAVVLGTPDGGVIYRKKEWDKPLSQTALVSKIVSRDEIARWILDEVGASKCQQLT